MIYLGYSHPYLFISPEEILNLFLAQPSHILNVELVIFLTYVLLYYHLFALNLNNLVLQGFLSTFWCLESDVSQDNCLTLSGPITNVCALKIISFEGIGYYLFVFLEVSSSSLEGEVAEVDCSIGFGHGAHIELKYL